MQDLPAALPSSCRSKTSHPIDIDLKTQGLNGFFQRLGDLHSQDLDPSQSAQEQRPETQVWLRVLKCYGEQATGARFVEKSEEQEQATSQMSGFIHEMKLRESTQKGNQEIVDNCTSRSNEVFGNVGGCMDVAGTESGQLQGRRSSRGALCPSNPATCLSFSLPFIVVT